MTKNELYWWTVAPGAKERVEGNVPQQNLNSDSAKTAAQIKMKFGAPGESWTKGHKMVVVVVVAMTSVTVLSARSLLACLRRQRKHYQKNV